MRSALLKTQPKSSEANRNLQAPHLNNSFLSTAKAHQQCIDPQPPRGGCPDSCRKAFGLDWIGCGFTMLHTAWAPRRRWLEAAFGRHRRWGPPPLLEGSLRQSSQSCTIQLPAWVEDKNLGSKMLPQESPANRRERCGDHMLAKPYFRHSRSCLSSRRGYINGWSSTICTQFGDGPSPITH